MKYFYNDPLAAAWMMKHFGMQFVNIENYADKEIREDQIVLTHREQPLYIHTDSLHLLEPQVGDIGFDDANVCFDRNQFGWTSLIEEGFEEPKGIIKISRRNNIAFMWPETEE